MPNLALQRKIKETINNLSTMTDTQLADMLADTRSQFDKPITGEDRREFLSLYEKVNREIFAREGVDITASAEVFAPENIKNEIDSMDSKTLANELAKSQKVVLETEYLLQDSKEYKAEKERLKHLQIAQVRAQEAERMEKEEELSQIRQREIEAEIRQKQACSGVRSALDDSLDGL